MSNTCIRMAIYPVYGQEPEIFFTFYIKTDDFYTEAEHQINLDDIKQITSVNALKAYFEKQTLKFSDKYYTRIFEILNNGYINQSGLFWAKEIFFTSFTL